MIVQGNLKKKWKLPSQYGIQSLENKGRLRNELKLFKVEKTLLYQKTVFADQTLVNLCDVSNTMTLVYLFH